MNKSQAAVLNENVDNLVCTGIEIKSFSHNITGVIVNDHSFMRSDEEFNKVLLSTGRFINLNLFIRKYSYPSK